ncbi:hypothetical protein SDC9_17642 [bioreactor metagenome]|jgi:hypothetical protein|uniref:Uncharacterized protein n=1 Tax=bioreactor metagenome TaxID=1076179 RepID=A0A644TY03_9ZZZZ|nr:hypothetical protein [Lentimicrobium sp.]MEA5111719.1 hypothetical protein [Lentimicrobium sp.]
MNIHVNILASAITNAKEVLDYLQKAISENPEFVKALNPAEVNLLAATADCAIDKLADNKAKMLEAYSDADEKQAIIEAANYQIEKLNDLKKALE